MKCVSFRLSFTKIKQILMPALLLGLIFGAGCGATWQSDLDVIGFNKDDPAIKVSVNGKNGTTYELKTGDKMELLNIIADSPNDYLHLGGPTCFYMVDYLGLNKLLIQAGYYPLAKNQDGSVKYSDAFQNYAKAMTKYQLRITTKESGKTENIDIPYGEDGAIMIENLQGYQFRSDTNVTYAASALFRSLALPHGFDRTICFVSGKDVKFEVGELASNVSMVDNVPSLPSDTPKDPIKIVDPSSASAPTAGGPGGATSPTGGSGAAATGSGGSAPQGSTGSCALFAGSADAAPSVWACLGLALLPLLVDRGRRRFLAKR